MLISPITAITQQWITHPTCKTVEEYEAKSFVNPNALDFTLDKLWRVDGSSPAIITEAGKTNRKLIPVEPNDEGQWVLEPNVLYDGMSDFYVRVPEGASAHLIIRSTFNRNGLTLNSGQYDSSYNGHIGFTLFNRSGPIVTAPGTRVGQIVFTTSDSYGSYKGGYNHSIGTHWTSST